MDSERYVCVECGNSYLGKVMKKIYKHDLAEAYLIACYGFEKYIKK